MTSDGRQAIKQRSAGVVASMALHVVVIGAFFLVGLYLARQPKEGPTEVKFFSPPPPPPPPPPPGGGHHQKTPHKVTPKIIPKKQFVQPKEVPKEQPKQAKKEEKEEEDEPAGVEGGVKGGVEGGVVGGVIGGVVGGVLGGTGAPGGYEKVSRPPNRIAGEKDPSIPPSMLTVLRGSKGIIMVKIKINEHGGIDAVEIVRSTVPILNDVVIRHIKSFWKFEAPMNAGHATKIEYLQPFTFVFN